MENNKKYSIKVPASTANLGPGFDSIGAAVNLYLSLKAEESDFWSFETLNKELKDFPKDHTHFIARVALKTAENFGCTLSPCKVEVESDIPLAKGLGSSAAAIVAGIELADISCGLQLNKQEKLQLATEMEGHPDNVGASLCGGVVVGKYSDGHAEMASITGMDFEMAAIIPSQSLLTEVSRDVLPSYLKYSQAVQASAAANLLLASLVGRNWELAGKMMKSDLFHQPYRRPLIPLFNEVEDLAYSLGAFGVAISGAGPSIICFSEPGGGEKLAAGLSASIVGCRVASLKIDHNGSQAFRRKDNAYSPKAMR